jgi:hypothetical protein
MLRFCTLRQLHPASFVTKRLVLESRRNRHKGIIVWGGEQEVLIDSIDAIARRLKDSFPKTEYVRSQEGAHVGWLSHKLIGIAGKEESTQAIESWMAARL